jgi:hypothetical protein
MTGSNHSNVNMPCLASNPDFRGGETTAESRNAYDTWYNVRRLKPLLQGIRPKVTDVGDNGLALSVKIEINEEAPYPGVGQMQEDLHA